MALDGIILALLAVTAGAVIQGSIGFGFALVAVPALTLVHAEALPATLLIVALPMAVAMAVRERGAIDRAGFLHATVGRVFGTAAGVSLLLAVPRDSLAVLVGAVILVAVAMSVFAPRLDADRRTTLAAGFASGVMGTAAAIGGPPLALAYQSRPGSELRSTLAASFVAGSAMSLGALLFAEEVEAWHALLALELLPGVAVGLAASRYVLRWLDGRWLRPAVLAFAAVAGTAAVVRGVAG